MIFLDFERSSKTNAISEELVDLLSPLSFRLFVLVGEEFRAGLSPGLTIVNEISEELVDLLSPLSFLLFVLVGEEFRVGFSPGLTIVNIPTSVDSEGD